MVDPCLGSPFEDAFFGNDPTTSALGFLMVLLCLEDDMEGGLCHVFPSIADLVACEVGLESA